eukprot:362642_1
MDYKSLEISTEHKSHGNSFLREGRFEFAISAYSAAIIVCPNDETDHLSICYANRAQAYIETHDFWLAIRDATVSIHANPDYIKAYWRRAVAYEHVDEPDALVHALRDYEMTLVIDASHAYPRNVYDRLMQRLYPSMPITSLFDRMGVLSQRKNAVLLKSGKFDTVTELLQLISPVEFNVEDCEDTGTDSNGHKL